MYYRDCFILDSMLLNTKEAQELRKVYSYNHYTLIRGLNSSKETELPMILV